MAAIPTHEARAREQPATRPSATLGLEPRIGPHRGSERAAATRFEMSRHTSSLAPAPLLPPWPGALPVNTMICRRGGAAALAA